MAQWRNGQEIPKHLLSSISGNKVKNKLISEIMEPTHLKSRFKTLLNDCRKAINEVFYGMTVHGLELELRKEKGNLNNLLMLMVVGNLAGLPLFPPYYSMRLLPYIIPYIGTWKRNIQREKDLTDIMSVDI